MSILFTLCSSTSSISVTSILWGFSTWTDDDRVPEGLSSFLGVALSMNAVRGCVDIAQSTQKVYFLEHESDIYACSCTHEMDEARAFGHLNYCVENTHRKMGVSLKECVQRSARHYEGQRSSGGAQHVATLEEMEIRQEDAGENAALFDEDDENYPSVRHHRLRRSFMLMISCAAFSYFFLCGVAFLLLLLALRCQGVACVKN